MKNINLPLPNLLLRSNRQRPSSPFRTSFVKPFSSLQSPPAWLISANENPYARQQRTGKRSVWALSMTWHMRRRNGWTCSRTSCTKPLGKGWKALGNKQRLHNCAHGLRGQATWPWKFSSPSDILDYLGVAFEWGRKSQIDTVDLANLQKWLRFVLLPIFSNYSAKLVEDSVTSHTEGNKISPHVDI